MRKLDSLRSINIGQSAAKLRIGERSSTILKGSTRASTGKREAHGYVYCLADPLSLEVRYVGSTKRHIVIRLAEHFMLRDNCPNLALQGWLKSVDCEPFIWYKKYPLRLLSKAERYWIRYYKLDNRLLNVAKFNYSDFKTDLDMKKVKAVDRVCIYTGEIVTYSSMSEAASKNSCHTGNMTNCIKGLRQTAGGFA